jgi:hypothetical protein
MIDDAEETYLYYEKLAAERAAKLVGHDQEKAMRAARTALVMARAMVDAPVHSLHHRATPNEALSIASDLMFIMGTVGPRAVACMLKDLRAKIRAAASRED